MLVAVLIYGLGSRHCGGARRSTGSPTPFPFVPPLDFVWESALVKKWFSVVCLAFALLANFLRIILFHWLGHALREGILRLLCLLLHAQRIGSFWALPLFPNRFCSVGE